MESSSRVWLNTQANPNYGFGPIQKIHPYDVVSGDRIIGRDPDPFIRGQLLREYNSGRNLIPDDFLDVSIPPVLRAGTSDKWTAEQGVHRRTPCSPPLRPAAPSRAGGCSRS